MIIDIAESARQKEAMKNMAKEIGKAFEEARKEEEKQLKLP